MNINKYLVFGSSDVPAIFNIIATTKSKNVKTGDRTYKILRGQKSIKNWQKFIGYVIMTLKL